MTAGRNVFTSAFAIAIALTLLCGPTSTRAQSVGQQCIEQGHKPGTAGFYHCLQETSSRDSAKSGLESQDQDAGSILSGDPQNAVSDYAGSTMDGATKPDPDILKNFDPGRGPGR